MLKLDTMGGRRIDLNSADLSVILQQTVLDARKAEVLMDARPFWDNSELRMLPGFGKKTLLKLADVATVVPPQPIDINLCSTADLQSIPGVGTVLARRIVEERPYGSLEDVGLVKGISTNVMHVLRQRSVVVVEAHNNVTESDWSNTSALDINNCDKELLLQLRGVGPKLAERIVSSRPFDYIDDLREVKGVGVNLFEKLDDLCVVSSTVVQDMQAEFVEEDTWFAEGVFENPSFESNTALPQVVNPVMSLVAYEAAVDQEIRRRIPLLLSGWIVAIVIIVGLFVLGKNDFVSFNFNWPW
jgi:DNA uptake protein ComE-like DNA-binding protein